MKLVQEENPSLEIVVNPEKPRKGTFEVRVKDKEEPIVSLVAMKRRFVPLRELDMEKVAADIAKAL